MTPAQPAAVPPGLHARWEEGAGLLVWSAEPGRVRFLARALGRRSPRHRVRMPWQEEAGSGYEALGFAPAAAADFLTALGTESAPVRPAETGEDLGYLAAVVAGIDRWAAAGQVVADLRRVDDEWWPRWALEWGAAQRAWRAQWAAAMPSAVQGPGAEPASAFDDFTAAMTDAVVRRRLAAGGEPPDPPSHPLLAALVAGDPVAEHGAAAAGRVAAWQEGARSGGLQLVLRLLEPAEAADVAGDHGAGDCSAGDFGTVPSAPGCGERASAVDGGDLWRLQVCVRSEDRAPVPLSLTQADRESVRVCIGALEEAMRVYPLLRELPRDRDSLDMLMPEAAVSDLVQHGAQALSSASITVLLPRAWRVVEPTVRVRVSSPDVPAAPGEARTGLDHLVEFDMEVALGDTVLRPGELDELARRNSDLVKLRGEWVRADGAALHDAARYLSARRADPATLAALLRTLATDPPPVPLGAVSATGWVKALFGEESAADRAVPAPAGLAAQLRDYQLRGLAWMSYMADLGLGGMLADDMGLGKTVQVLALEVRARERGAHRPTLVVCPMSVVGNWEREAARFAPGLRVHVHHGAARPRGDDLAARLDASDLVLTTYALLARDVEELRALRFERVVLDEAQHIKNERTAQARAARKLQARHRLALTGTPVENRLSELRAILDFVNPGMLGSAAKFRAAFTVPIETERDPHALARLRAVTAPFVLRRVKTDRAVVADLPDKQEMTVRVNLTAEQATLYRAVLDDLEEKLDGAQGMARRGAVLTALLHLKQVCNHPAHYLGDGSALMRHGRHRSGKLALVEDVVGDVLADGEKILLFTQFREFAMMVGPWLADRFGLDEVPVLHGGVARGAREGMIAAFQASGGPQVMVLSLKAGGTGLNLTAANHVVHLDRWWNPAVEDQATDRAFRIGQTRDVQVRKLVAVGTLEERIDELLAGKSELAELSVRGGESWVTELDDKALHILVALGEEAQGE
ncbi:DEAD/DEAH box helicase [Tomitella cavernea]|uniref:DEAD/DEAH box helicase n=1 Tax=Tomitella cavernea TaxID=1387982 RepID=A0ABP9CL32_9ACTN|nr:DEAD/DEAH box helicase [Tomitella cavernea]